MLRAGAEVDVPVAQIGIGDVIVVKPGERIATDGIVITGHSAVDESMITGESVPRDKKPGDAVIGATVNKEGLLKFEASAVGKHTALAGIIRLVERAQGSKAPIQALADKISAWFVPAVLAVAALTFAGWLLLGRSSFETGADQCDFGAGDRVPVRARVGHADGDHGGHGPRRGERHPLSQQRGA